MPKKSIKQKTKIDKKALVETLKKTKIEPLIKEPEKRITEIKEENPPKQIPQLEEDFQEEQEWSFTPTAHSSFSLERKIVPINPINLEQIGEQELSPKNNESEKKDTPYTVKYSSNDYKTNKNYELHTDNREDSNLNNSNNTPAGQPRSTFDQIYSNVRPEQETSGVEDLRASEEGYKRLDKKRHY